MKWRAFSRMPQWVRLSEWLGRIVALRKMNLDFWILLGQPLDEQLKNLCLKFGKNHFLP